MIWSIFNQSKWNLGAFLLLMVAPLVISSCTKAPAKVKTVDGKKVVIFIDFSSSISRRDQGLFELDVKERILPSLEAGDQILIAPINDRTLTDFSPMVEETFPPKVEFNGWADNVLKFRQKEQTTSGRVKEIRERVQAGVGKIFKQRFSAQHTDIFSSLLISERLFHNESRHKVLVLMSDMIEDYPPYHFQKIRWSQARTEKLLSELKSKDLIPDLSGVCVYVAGVSGRSPHQAQDIGNFWQAYFKRTGADMHPSRYAHVLLHWPPSQSCNFSS